LPNSKKIETLLAGYLSEYCFSGYQLVSAFGTDTFSLCGGKTSHTNEGVAVAKNTFFDIGSLTKVIVTVSALARAYDRSEISLDDQLKKFAPVFAGSAFGELSLGALLTHSSGLVGWVPFYRELSGQEIAGKIECWLLKNEKRLFEGTGKSIYSDIGFILLGFVLKKIWGGISEAFETEIARPLHLKGIQFPPISGTCAATEYCLTRKKILVGEVFDENTWALGGVSSHAGLFASAEALAPWCEAWLNSRLGKSEWLKPSTATLFTQNAHKAPGTWSYGWDTKSKAFSSAGQFLSLQSFGHLGYPGVSVWVDPEHQGYVIFFTNRIHPSRVDERIKQIRPALHDEVARFWGIAS
jgi:serine-type D-Ala-D-Ala carboxypeptidase